MSSADRERRVNKRKQEWKEVLNAGKEQRYETESKILRRDRRSLLLENTNDDDNDDWREKLLKRRIEDASSTTSSQRESLRAAQGEIVHAAKRSLDLDDVEEDLKAKREERLKEEFREKNRVEEEQRLREKADLDAKRAEAEVRAKENRRLALEREMAPPPSDRTSPERPVPQRHLHMPDPPSLERPPMARRREMKDEFRPQINSNPSAEFEPAITLWDKALLLLFTSSCCVGGEVV